MAGLANAPLILFPHDLRPALEQLKLGKQKGFKVYGKTCTQYFFTTQADLDKEGFEGAGDMSVAHPSARKPIKSFLGAVDGTPRHFNRSLPPLTLKVKRLGQRQLC
ncbi:MAG: hypothetical protein R2880_16270 [Deinococcales bacterium]